MPVQRNTKQKQIILDCLKNLREKHVTADELTELVHETAPSVGRATVYRYLRQLHEEGTVKKYTIPDGGGYCWQYVGEDSHCHSHYHLKCNSCGEVVHLEDKLLDAFSENLKETAGFEIDEGDTVFYGKCSKCKNK